MLSDRCNLDDCQGYVCEFHSLRSEAQEYITALEAELATVLDVAIARGEQLHYEDLDYRERLASLVPQEVTDAAND